MQRNRRLDSFNYHRLERPAHTSDSQLAGARMHDHFGDQGIIKRRHPISRIHIGIDAHAGPAGKIKRSNRARRRRERFRIFSIDATFDRVTNHDHIILRKTKRLSFSDTNLIANDIRQRNHLSNRMLDLNTGIHFHEIKLIIFVKQEFNCAGT